jgi:glutamyl/glutaminyl-tRNA synthetase
LAQLLGRDTPPRFLHHTLLMRPDGSKLSKATHDTSLREMRLAGVRPAQLLAAAARRAGLCDTRELPVAEVPSLFT